MWLTVCKFHVVAKLVKMIIIRKVTRYVLNCVAYDTNNTHVTCLLATLTIGLLLIGLLTVWLISMSRDLHELLFVYAYTSYFKLFSRPHKVRRQCFSCKLYATVFSPPSSTSVRLSAHQCLRVPWVTDGRSMYGSSELRVPLTVVVLLPLLMLTL